MKTIGSSILVLAAAALNLLLSGVSYAQNQTDNICEQSVSYRIVPPSDQVPVNMRSFSGIWVGRNENARCLALFVESIEPDGMARVKMAYGALPGLKAAQNVVTAKISGSVMTRQSGSDAQVFTLKSQTELHYKVVGKAYQTSGSLSKR